MGQELLGRGRLSAREVRERLHEISGELDALAPHVEALVTSDLWENHRTPRSPFTHATSRDLWWEASKARSCFLEARKRIRMTDARLRFIDDDPAKLPHLKRLTRRTRLQEIPQAA